MLLIIKRKPVVFISLLIKALTMLMMPKFIHRSNDPGIIDVKDI